MSGSRFIRICAAASLAAVLLSSACRDVLASPAGRFDARIEQAAAQGEAARAAKAAACEEGYLQQLDRLNGRYQAAGDLESLLAVRQERDRFQSQRGIPLKAVVSEPSEMRRAQMQFLDGMEDALAEKNRAIIAAVESCLAQLESEERSFSAAGRLEEAAAASDEKARLEGSRIVSLARFELEAYEASLAQRPRGDEGREATPARTKEPSVDVRKPEPTPPQPAKPKEVVKEKPQAAPPAATKETRVVRGVRIYADSKAAPPLPFPEFRTAVMNRSSLAPMKNIVSAKVWLRKTAGSTRELGRSQPSAETGETSLRLTLASGQKSEHIPNSLVVVQFFTRTTSSRSKPEPTERMLKRVMLDDISGEPVTLDFPGFDGWNASGRGRSGDGEEFYGVLISVFDGRGVLVYQAMSSRGLESIASAQAPGPTMEERLEMKRQELESARQAVAKAQRLSAQDPDDATLKQAHERATERLERLKQELERLQSEARHGGPR